MNPCLKARIQTAVARSLAVVATGVVSWYVAQPIAQHFEKTLTDPMQIGIGLVAAVIALFISKRALDFTQDCMTVPDSALAPAAVGAERKCRKRSCQVRFSDDAPEPGAGKSECANKPGSGKTDRASDKPGATTPNTGCDAARSAVNITVADHASMKVSLSTDQGATVVTVDITGVSSSKFKDKQSGLRKKLENIGGVKWENPRNLGENKRQMVGRIVDTSRRESIVQRLQGLASSL